MLLSYPTGGAPYYGKMASDKKNENIVRLNHEQLSNLANRYSEHDTDSTSHVSAKAVGTYNAIALLHTKIARELRDHDRDGADKCQVGQQ